MTGVCATAVHAAMTVDLETFKAATKNHREWNFDGDVLLIGECPCGSTISIALQVRQ